VKLRAAITILTVLALTTIAGCTGATSPRKPLPGGKELLTVDFEQDQALQYKFVSKREIVIDWDPTGKMSKSGRNALDKSTELLEMVVEYTPVEVKPYDLSTIRAECKSVKVERSKRAGGPAGAKDAAEYAAGRTYTLKVGPTGKIEDYSELDKLIKEIGEKAFRSTGGRGRIKEPDMIGDCIAALWFPYDSVSSIQQVSEGVAVGQSWKSTLPVPTPMVMRKARDVTYTLKEIRKTNAGRTAVIHSAYTLAESAPQDWPIPYSGRFQMSGTFGFLSGYKVRSLEGQGEELFNIDKGRTDNYSQQYEMQLDSALPIGIDANPRITIKQTMTMQLLDAPQ
jgi:hypothetical protein